MKKRVALITFGCAKNLVDSEVMAGRLEEAGYRSVAEPSGADIIVLNTCGFIGPAKEEAEQAIQDALAIKKRDRTKKVVVAGCYSGRYKESLCQRYPEVDAWLGVKEFDRIVDVIEGRPFQVEDRTFLYDHATPRMISTPRSWAYIKVSEGCSHACAFCSIPLIKGAYRSREISSVVEEARALVRRGVREVNLISQDTTYFGRDQGLRDGLVRLLRELIDVRGLAWIRILYGYPEEITDGLLEIMQEPKICPYLDIPFQHADPVLIRRMKRGMDGVLALKLLDKIRGKIPGVAVRTSIVVGFPGEGGQEFERLRHFVREAQFDHLGVFSYSREEGTKAFKRGDPVAESVKQSRLRRIFELQARISAAKLRSYIRQTIDVIIEGVLKKNPAFLVGRSRFQAPEVDGVVFVRAPEYWTRASRSKASSEYPSLSRMGSCLAKVEIRDSSVYDLAGTLSE
jgi:ribosomal protein S12 methylthiotransferase